MYNQSITDVDGTVTELRHSERNALHQEVSRLQGQQGSEIQTLFEYDAMGRLVSTNTHHEKNPNPNKQLSKNLIERNYVYDTIGQLTDISGSTQLVGGIGNNANNANNTNSKDRYQRRHHYQYDSVGRLTRHKLTDFANSSGTEERFAFDPASNRVPVKYESTTDEQDSLYQDTAFTADMSAKSKSWKRVNTLTTHNKEIGYYYDCHGRIEVKTQTPLGTDGKVLKQSGDSIVGYLDTLKLFYNPNNDLERSERVRQEGFEVVKTTTRYQYDAFGRRVAKVSETQNKSKLSPHSNRLLPFEKAYQSEKTQKNCVFMLWDGNRQIQEYADSHVFTTVYEQDSFVPVARLVSSYADNADMKVYHYHTDHLGTPNELTDDKGKVVWLADYDAWGNVSKICDKFKYQEHNVGGVDISADDLQPIRFQGQFFDGETGLHYNRFRYYDGDVGMFISRDPIGLMGGMNNFQYAPNPVGWVDPLGLKYADRPDGKTYAKICDRPLGAAQSIYSATPKFFGTDIKSWQSNGSFGIDMKLSHTQIFYSDRTNSGYSAGQADYKEDFDMYSDEFKGLYTCTSVRYDGKTMKQAEINVKAIPDNPLNRITFENKTGNYLWSKIKPSEGGKQYDADNYPNTFTAPINNCQDYVTDVTKEYHVLKGQKD